MGTKEELHEDGHSEADIAKAIEEVRTRIENEEIPPDFEAIKKRISEEWATGTSAELKVVDTASKPNMVMKQRKKRPVRYRLPKEGLFAPPIKMKRISRNSYPAMEEAILSGFPK